MFRWKDNKTSISKKSFVSNEQLTLLWNFRECILTNKSWNQLSELCTRCNCRQHQNGLMSSKQCFFFGSTSTKWLFLNNTFVAVASISCSKWNASFEEYIHNIRRKKKKRVQETPLTSVFSFLELSETIKHGKMYFMGIISSAGAHLLTKLLG